MFREAMTTLALLAQLAVAWSVAGEGDSKQTRKERKEGSSSFFVRGPRFTGALHWQNRDGSSNIPHRLRSMPVGQNRVALETIAFPKNAAPKRARNLPTVPSARRRNAGALEAA